MLMWFGFLILVLCIVIDCNYLVVLARLTDLFPSNSPKIEEWFQLSGFLRKTDQSWLMGKTALIHNLSLWFYANNCECFYCV